MEEMIKSTDKGSIDFRLSHINADSGFDVKAFIGFIEKYKMIANIKQNNRNTKKKEQEYRYMSDYIYQFRFKIEAIFAWLDTYKQLQIRFEFLARNFKAGLLMGAGLINFRHIFN
jgi:transposase